MFCIFTLAPPLYLPTMDVFHKGQLQLTQYHLWYLSIRKAPLHCKILHINSTTLVLRIPQQITLSGVLRVPKKRPNFFAPYTHCATQILATIPAKVDNKPPASVQRAFFTLAAKLCQNHIEV